MNTEPNMGGVGKIGREANRGNKAGKQIEQRQMILAIDETSLQNNVFIMTKNHN